MQSRLHPPTRFPRTAKPRQGGSRIPAHADQALAGFAPWRPLDVEIGFVALANLESTVHQHSYRIPKEGWGDKKATSRAPPNRAWQLLRVQAIREQVIPFPAKLQTVDRLV